MGRHPIAWMVGGNRSDINTLDTALYGGTYPEISYVDGLNKIRGKLCLCNRRTGFAIRTCFARVFGLIVVVCVFLTLEAEDNFPE